MAELKKRKRTSMAGPGSTAPKAKRHAVEKGEDAFAWKEASLHETTNPPFILEPAGCQIPDDITFRVYTRDRRGAEVPKNPTAVERKEYLLYSNDDPVFEFKGSEDPFTRWTRLYVGVENPKTGKKEMVQTKKIIVRAVPKAKLAPRSAPGDQNKHEPTRTEIMNDLGQLFGSKRAKKAIEEKARNEIAMPTRNADGTPRKLEAAEEATLDAIGSAAVGMATREELQAAADAVKPIPKANLEAEDIQDVYDPLALIGSEILNSIRVNDWQHAVDTNEGVRIPSKYVASRLNAVAQGPNNTSRLRLLRYTYWLILYYANTTRKRQSRFAMLKKNFKALAGASDQVVDHLQAKFTNGRGEMNSFYDSLLLTHIFAFASVLDNFEFDIQFLREDLKIDHEKFCTHFHEIGGRVKESKQKSTNRVRYIAKLALPLQFPKQRRMKQRRK